LQKKVPPQDGRETNKNLKEKERKDAKENKHQKKKTNNKR